MSDEKKGLEIVEEIVEGADTANAHIEEGVTEVSDHTSPVEESEDVVKEEKKGQRKVVTPLGNVEAELVLEGLEESNETIDHKAEVLCRWAAARAGVITLTPLLGTVALMANEVYLVSRLAKLYDKKISESAILSFLGAFGGTLAGNLLATLIPFGGIQVPIAVGVTYAVGKASEAWIREGMPADVTPYVELFKDWKDKAKQEIRVISESPLKNIPLGDETKDYLKLNGQHLSESLQEMRARMFDILEISKNILQDEQGVLAEHLGVVKEKAAQSAAVLRERAAKRADEIKEKAAVSADSLKEKAAVGADTLKGKSQDAAIGVADMISDMADKLSAVADKTRTKIEEHKAVDQLDDELKELKHLVEEARLLAEELKTPTDISLSQIDEAGSDLDELIRDALRDVSQTEKGKDESTTVKEADELENK